MVRGIISQDARYTVEELAMWSGIKFVNGFYNITATTKTRWVSHLLTGEQKQNAVDCVKQSLDKYEHCDQKRLKEIVTGDETWIYFFNQIWRGTIKHGSGNTARCHNVACRGWTVKRIMHALFFDAKRPVAQIPVPERASVSG